MEFFRRAAINPRRLGIFPGTFNPVTVAHLALANAALSAVDEVVFVLPRMFPHKHYSGASFDQRIDMLNSALPERAPYSLAASEGGLFDEIAAEIRTHYAPGVKLTFLCGRDAAERIVGWDYGSPGVFAEMLTRFDLLVAAREGDYSPPSEFEGLISPLALSGRYDYVSASEVRRRIAQGEPWQQLVPEPIRSKIPRNYSSAARPDSPAER